jgi:hypothetical protein
MPRDNLVKKLPLWAQLRIAHDFADDDEREKLENLAETIIDRHPDIQKVIGRPEAACMFWKQQSSCVDLAMLACTDSLQLSITHPCAFVLQQSSCSLEQCSVFCQHGLQRNSCLVNCQGWNMQGSPYSSETTELAKAKKRIGRKKKGNQ